MDWLSSFCSGAKVLIYSESFNLVQFSECLGCRLLTNYNFSKVTLNTIPVIIIILLGFRSQQEAAAAARLSLAEVSKLCWHRVGCHHQHRAHPATCMGSDSFHNCHRRTSAYDGGWRPMFAQILPAWAWTMDTDVSFLYKLNHFERGRGPTCRTCASFELTSLLSLRSFLMRSRPPPLRGGSCR